MNTQGVFFLGMDTPGKWSGEELRHITAFIDNVLKSQRSLISGGLVHLTFRQRTRPVGILPDGRGRAAECAGSKTA